MMASTRVDLRAVQMAESKVDNLAGRMVENLAVLMVASMADMRAALMDVSTVVQWVVLKECKTPQQLL